MDSVSPKRLLFIINPNSGNNTINYNEVIHEYFTNSPHTAILFELPENCELKTLRNKIKEADADRIVAVGGDGTLKLVAECMEGNTTPLAVIPAGSANGMATELQIPEDPATAIDIAINGQVKAIHTIKVNKEFCIHLADIGFNAFTVKMFEKEKVRGMWGYVKAAAKALVRNPKMAVRIKADDKTVTRRAEMVVIANATKYGTGVVINPEGKLDDDLFEVVVVRKISVIEIFKMRVTHSPFDPTKTEVFQTHSLQIESRRKVHFQVDGEYLGKVNKVDAEINTNAIKMVVPDSYR